MALNSAQIIDELRLLIAEYNSLAVNLPAGALSTRPSPDKWSPAEIIDHLRASTDSYRPKFAHVFAGTYKSPWHAKIGFLVTTFGRMILKAVSPGSKAMKTFPVFEPRTVNIEATVLDDFRSSQEWLIDVVPKLERAGLFNFVIASAASTVVVYTIGTALEILVNHQRRHLQQMEETCEILSRNHGSGR